MNEVTHLSATTLESGMEEILASPRDEGVLRMIVCRPRENERVVLEEGRLDPSVGLIGDNWAKRFSRRTEDGSAHPDMQLNIMNARAIALIATMESRWPLAGDQLFIDLDLSGDNLPPGTRVSLGSAVIEVTKIPHRGCAKFTERFGLDAMRFVNSALGRAHNLRGINAKVIEAGMVRPGDSVTVHR